MESRDYKNLIDFSKLKVCIANKRTTIKYLAEDSGTQQVRISQIIAGLSFPKTDIVAKICFVLKVPVTEIMEFKGINTKSYFENKEHLYKLPESPIGELTYAPLWLLLDDFFKQEKAKTGTCRTANDLFDLIESSRRAAGTVPDTKKAIEASLKARGIDEGYIPKIQRERKPYPKGLTPETRTKLRKDRPLSIRTVYDICAFLQCTPDWIMSYK